MNIYGKNVVKAYLLEKKPIKKIYITSNFKENEILDLIKKGQYQVIFLKKNQMDKMVAGLHQGIIAEIPEFQYTDLQTMIKDNGFLVILDHLEDPHNFGAIIRTCEAAGVDGIIIPKDRSVCVNSTVMKVSTGAITSIKIAMVTNIQHTIEQLKKSGYWIIGTDMEGTSYKEIDYMGSIAIVIGNEGNGMRPLVSKSCDFIASIPMKGQTNSLNASVATGIIVFEASIERGKNGL